MNPNDQKPQYAQDVALSKSTLKGFVVVEVATCHITKKDDELLRANVDAKPTEHPQVIMEYEHGFFVSTWHDATDESADSEWAAFLRQIKEIGHSEAYINLIRVAHDAGAKWLNLDVDAFDYDFLPRFEW